MEAYEVGKRIGRGNYGSVYVARDKRNQRWYCLKMILMEAHSDEERGARRTNTRPVTADWRQLSSSPSLSPCAGCGV